MWSIDRPALNTWRSLRSRDEQNLQTTSKNDDMFGFLKGPCGNRLYRQVYSGCCGVQHREYGVSSLVFLSYEAIFVYLFAMDTEQFGRPDENAVTCCRLRKNEKIRSAVDEQFAKYSAALGVLLAAIKLNDDVEDDHSIPAMLVRWKLIKPIAKAHRYFQNLDANFEQRTSGYLKAHATLEGGSKFIKLDQYVLPTANAFGYVFGLASQMFDDPKLAKNSLTQLGHHVGAAIIAFDCAVDWQRDQRKGSFNPLPDEDAVQQSLQLCRRHLAQAIWLCSDLFGKESQSAAVLKATFDRACRTSTSRSRKKPSWGNVRKSGWAVLRRGDCDCPAEACCEGCSQGSEGCGTCCKICECCDRCGNCDCGNCDCGERRKKTRETAKRNQPNPPGTPTANVGSRGVAVGPLNPSGVVRINSADYPAKTSGSWVDNGEFVEVVAFDAFGLVVIPLRDIQIQGKP